MILFVIVRQGGNKYIYFIAIDIAREYSLTEEGHTITYSANSNGKSPLCTRFPYISV